ncbi:hypothetical protein EV715DRAFT_198204 [Schizophyllum commune]
MSSPSSSKKNLPPKRQAPAMRPVKPPLSTVSFSNFIYVLVALLALTAAYFSYRTLQIKTEVGGWWNLALGKRPNYMAPPEGRHPDKIGKHANDDTVESRIEALAEALGIKSNDLASAIAVAVKEYVPPASLSSIASSQTGDAVDAMITETPEKGQGQAAGQPKKGEAGWMDTLVGLDEP